MFNKLIASYYQRFRLFIYKNLSTNKHVIGTPTINQPTIFCGEGRISFGKNVWLGYFPSPKFYSGSIHIEARRPNAEIFFGNNIYINNNFTIVAEASSISIGDDVLIGTNVEIIDSDFHGLHPNERNTGNHIAEPVIIGRNVFIGSNVCIVKGVNIGENSVIANGSVVTASFPSNVIIGGNPAKIIRYFDDDRSSKGN